MKEGFVEERGDGYWVAGSRVSLDSIVCEFLKGRSPEAIADSFPVLTLEQVYGAITFYLGRRPEIDLAIEREHREFEALQRRSRDEHPLLYGKLDQARPQMPKSG